MKPLVCIFAHPDDEAFGPSGSIAKFAKERDVYIICVTNGDAGVNPKQAENLGEIRKQELLDSAQILGVKDVIFLGFKDGCICNKDYHTIAEKIEGELTKLQPATLLTFYTTGVSGHIDHIAVSLITTFVFKKLEFVNSLLYWNESEEILEGYRPYFIYMPPGFNKDNVDLKVDVSDFWETKIKSMWAHESQRNDAQMIKRVIDRFPKEEYFKKLSK
jgi:N-acetylglucosamine malate deacetylase 2